MNLNHNNSVAYFLLISNSDESSHNLPTLESSVDYSQPENGDFTSTSSSVSPPL